MQSDTEHKPDFSFIIILKILILHNSMNEIYSGSPSFYLGFATHQLLNTQKKIQEK
jgi:hypothetical protein